MTEEPIKNEQQKEDSTVNDNLPKELTSPTLRRGKWTSEEERYTEKIIMDFENGTLDVPEGTTLRTFLSRVLNCDPMRITKKYTGNSSIGKRTFTPLQGSPENLSFIDMSRKDLENLRQIWVNKLQIAEQWNQRKISFMKSSSGKLFIPQELFTITAALPISSLVFVPAVGSGNESNQANMPIDFANYAKAQEQGVALHDEKIALALQPFCDNPAELNYLMHWLKSSVHAIQHATSPQDLDQLIQIGELSLPNLFKASSSSSSQQAQVLQPRRSNCHPQLEDLQRVIEAYFDHRNLPSDVAYRVYHDNQGSSSASDGRRNKGAASSTSAEKKRGGGTVSKDHSLQSDSLKLQQQQQVPSGRIEVKEANHPSGAAAFPSPSMSAQAHRSPMLQQSHGQAPTHQQQARFISIYERKNPFPDHMMYMRPTSYNDASTAAASCSYWPGLMPLPSLPITMPISSSANMLRPSSSGSNSSADHPSSTQQQPQFMQLMGTTVKLPPRQSWLEDTLPVSAMGHGGRHHHHMQTHSSNTIPFDAYGMVSMHPQNRHTSNNGGGHSSKSTTPHSISSNCGERMSFAMSSESSERVPPKPKPSSRSEYKYNSELVLPQHHKRKAEDHHQTQTQHQSQRSHDSKKARTVAEETARQEKADAQVEAEDAAQALLGLFQG